MTSKVDRVGRRNDQFNGQLFWGDSDGWACCDFSEAKKKRKRINGGRK